MSGFELLAVEDRIIVEPEAQESVTDSGIIIPDMAKEKPTTGRVVAVGSGIALSNGEIMPLDVKVGDVVLFGKYSGHNIRHEEKDYITMKQGDVLAIMG